MDPCQTGDTLSHQTARKIRQRRQRNKVKSKKASGEEL